LGFASGFAASFNSPLAGILFAMEELQHVSNRLSTNIIWIILVASTVSTAVARGCSGNQNLMDSQLSQYLKNSVSGGSIDRLFGQHMWMLVSIPIGALSSLAGFVITRTITWLTLRIRKYRSVVPETLAFVLQAVLAACVGAVVFRITGLRGVWGVGYESMQQAFENKYTASEYMIFAAGKTVAMILGISVQGPGDLLEPILISGGFFGGGIGVVIQSFITSESMSEQVLRPCILFGMSSMFASCFRFPLTPVVIVLEMMGLETYSLILPVFFGCLTASLISSRFFDPLLDELMRVGSVDLHALAVQADAQAVAEAEQLRHSDHSSDSVASSDSKVSSLMRTISKSSLASSTNKFFVKIEDAVLSLSSSDTCIHHPRLHDNAVPMVHENADHATGKCEPLGAPSGLTAQSLSLQHAYYRKVRSPMGVNAMSRSDTLMEFRSWETCDRETVRTISGSIGTTYSAIAEVPLHLSTDSNSASLAATQEKFYDAIEDFDSILPETITNNASHAECLGIGA